MKKKWIAGLCAITCAFTMLMPAGNAQAKKEEITEVTGTAEAFESQKDTLTIPASTSETRPEVIRRTGVLTASNLKDTYTINVKKSALTLKLSSNSGTVYYAIKTMEGTEIKSGNCSVSWKEVETGILLNEGTYELELYANYADPAIDYTLDLYAVSAAETASLSMEKASFGFYGNDAQYRKIVVNKSGLLGVAAYSVSRYQVEDYYDGDSTALSSINIALCNSNKKEIVSKKYVSSYNKFMTYYGVKKGTYYIKLTGIDTNYYYCLKYAFKNCSNAATSKSKATKVTSKYKNYVVPAGNTSAMWFKIKVTKPKKLNAYVNYAGSDSISVELYKGTKSQYSSTIYPEKGIRFYMKSLQGNTVKWSKGTYYIKIKNNKYGDKSGGVVSVKVK